MTDITRRKLVSISGAMAILPVASLISTRLAIADDSPLVDVESDQAKALQYVAESVTEGKTCGNCALYQGEAGSTSGPCSLFPAQSVVAAGGCSAWAAKS